MKPKLINLLKLKKISNNILSNEIINKKDLIDLDEILTYELNNKERPKYFKRLSYFNNKSVPTLDIN